MMLAKDIDRTSNSFTNFLKYMPLILQYEGGYCEVPGDNGGATNMGVIQVEYDAYRKRNGLMVQSVRDITLTEVHDIYYESYWLVNRCDALPDGLNFIVFDTSINMGAGTAAKFLLQAIGLPIIGVVINDATIAALKSDWATNNGGKGLIIIAGKYLAIRRDRYISLAKIPHDTQFLKGWLNRLSDVSEYALPIIRKEGVNLNANILKPAPMKIITAKINQ
jgi:lysozyme family protein